MQFVNHFVPEKVHHIKGLGFDLRHDNVNLPEQYVPAIDQWLKGRLAAIKGQAGSDTLQREMSKIFGKWADLLSQMLSFL